MVHISKKAGLGGSPNRARVQDDTAQAAERKSRPNPEISSDTPATLQKIHQSFAKLNGGKKLFGGPFGVSSSKKLSASSNARRTGSGSSMLSEGTYLPLSDVVAFLETVVTYRLKDIMNQFSDLAQSGLTREMIDEVIKRRFDVEPAKLEHDIGNQNPNPNRSITELVSNAVDAMAENKGNVEVTIEDGRYVVEDAGKGMSAGEVFERLLIPKLSGKTGKETIGRFGIGFYTALPHLKNKNSLVVVDTKCEGMKAIRVEFRRLNGELGIRIGPSNRTKPGTRVEVVDSRIRQDVLESELRQNMGYVLGRSIMANGKTINKLDPKQIAVVGDGKIYVSKKWGSNGKAVITVGGVKIEEFQLKGKNAPKLVVFDFPLSTKLPESRNQIRVHADVVSQVKTFIDHASDFKDKDAGLRYLNGIAPIVQALQKRNELMDFANDLMEYARTKGKQHLRGKFLIPDEPLYDVVSDKSATRVDTLYLGKNWDDRYARPQEWSGRDKLLLVNFSGVAKSGAAYDKERGILLLDRTLYDAHLKDPAGIEVLTSIPPTEVKGEWDWSKPVSPTGSLDARQVKPAPTPKKTKLDPRVGRIIEKHPLLTSQQSKLEKLARSDPETLELLKHVSGVMTPLRKLGRLIRAWGWNIQKVFSQEGDRSFLAGGDSINSEQFLLRPDGTPILTGMHLRLIISGEGKDQVFIAQRFNGWWELQRPDGTPFIEGRFRRVLDKGEGQDRVFLVQDGDEMWRAFGNYGKELLNGSYRYIRMFGEGAHQSFVVWEKSDEDVPSYRRGREVGTSAGEGYHFKELNATGGELLRVLRPDGTPLFENRFVRIKVSGEAVNRTFAARDEKGVWQVFGYDGTKLLEGRFKDVGILGAGESRLILTEEKADPGEEMVTSRVLHMDGRKIIQGKFYVRGVMGKDEDQVVQVSTDKETQIYSIDGNLLFAGRFRDIRISGEGADRVFVMKEEGKLVRAIGADGTTLFREKADHINVYDIGTDRVFKIWDEGGLGILRHDGTPLLDPRYRDVKVWGDGPDRVFAVEVNKDRWKVLRTDGSPMFSEEFHKVDITKKGEHHFIVTREDFDGMTRVHRLDGTLVFETRHRSIINIYLTGSEENPIFVAPAGQLFAVNGVPLIDRIYDGSRIYGERDILSEDSAWVIATWLEDQKDFKTTQPFDIDHLRSEDAKRNLKRMIDSKLPSDVQEVALSILKFPPPLFDFALNIIPHTKMDLFSGKKLLENLIPWAEQHSAETLGFIFDIGISFGYGEEATPSNMEKLALVTEKLGHRHLGAFRDAVLKLHHLPWTLKWRNWQRLTSLPKEYHSYAYYLAMDVGDLIAPGQSQIPSVSEIDVISLIDLNTAVRAHRSVWGEFNGDLEQAVNLIENQIPGTNPEISRNLTRHAMYHLGAGGNLLYLRELIQNSLDAIRGEGSTGNTIDITSFEENGRHVLGITDPVGMSLADIINNLLFVGKSTKTEGELGKFGVGFFTIFPGAEEIRIKTGKGQGTVTLLTMRPFFDNERKEVVDVDLSYRIEQGDFKGTIIERVSSETIPAFDAALTRSGVFRHGRFIDKDEIEIRYNNNLVNEDIHLFGQREAVGLGQTRIYAAKHNAFTVGSLYVKDIPENYFDALPPKIRKLVVGHGIVIDLPSSTDLVRSRTDFVDPKRIDAILMPQVPSLLLEAYLRGFAKWGIGSSALPYDYFSEGLKFLSQGIRIPQEIKEDASALREGKVLKDYSRYQDERAFMQLITMLPCIDLGTEKLSLEEIADRMAWDSEIDLSKVPKWLKQLLEKSQREKDRRRLAERHLDKVADDMGTERFEVQKEWDRSEVIHPQALAYDAFLSTAEWVLDRMQLDTNVSLSSVWFHAGAGAYADKLRNYFYFTFTGAAFYAINMRNILVSPDFDSHQMHRFMFHLINSVTHEMTHNLLEQLGDWTHDPTFFRQQQEMVTKLLKAGPLELEQLWRELKEKYPDPTYMPPEDYLKALAERSMADKPGSNGTSAPPVGPRGPTEPYSGSINLMRQPITTPTVNQFLLWKGGITYLTR